MRVLALVPGGIERQLEFFPVLSQIKDAFEAAEIAVVADPEAKEVYRLSKDVTEVIPYSFQASNSPADWANLLGILRDREFEAVLTLTHSWSIGLLLWLSGIPTRVGYADGANNLFLTHRVPRQTTPTPALPYRDLLQVIKIQGKPVFPLVRVPQGDLTAVESLRQGAGLTVGYVAVYPGCTATGDTYPVGSWVPILKDFQQRQPDLPLALIQTPETAGAIASLKESLPDLTVVEPDSIGQLAALIAGANLLVAIQSYPLALAAALEVYALGLSPAPINFPYGSEERLVNVVSPTGKLADIAPDVVLKKIWNE
jgi:ADP-heptose:LPS heptosyltransferase